MFLKYVPWFLFEQTSVRCNFRKVSRPEPKEWKRYWKNLASVIREMPEWQVPEEFPGKKEYYLSLIFQNLEYFFPEKFPSAESTASRILFHSAEKIWNTMPRYQENPFLAEIIPFPINGGNRK